MEPREDGQQQQQQQLRLNASEVSALEAGFRDVYNKLSFQSCDQYFRTVLQARLQEDVGADVQQAQKDGFQRFLQEENSVATNGTMSTTNTNFTNTTLPPGTASSERITGAVFEIQGSCRGCQVTSQGSFTL